MKTLCYTVLALILIACSSSKPATNGQITALEAAVSTPQFVITPQWAEPLDQTSAQVLNALQPAGGIVNGNRIQIESGAHFIKLNPETIDIYLPYFGTRQISGGLPGNTGIVAEDAHYTLRSSNNDKEGQRNITVQTASNGESYTISIRLFAQGKATVVVNTTQRQSIRYVGTWE